MDYKVKDLTVKERKWIERLERVLQACPTDRLELVTIGDALLTVIDGAIVREHDLEIHDGRADSNGVVLGYVVGKPLVHGVSG